jgi:predicted SAM-dependent methyltransferase
LENLKYSKKPAVDFIGDITDLSQFDDECVEEIYASHVLEHVGLAKIAATFNGLQRILKKEGKLYISVLNLDIIAKIFVLLPEGQDKYNVMAMIYGGQTDSHDFHYIGYWPNLLFSILTKAKFRRYEKVEFFNIFKDTSNMRVKILNGPIPISLNVIAYK